MNGALQPHNVRMIGQRMDLGKKGAVQLSKLHWAEVEAEVHAYCTKAIDDWATQELAEIEAARVAEIERIMKG